jgi:hypothetical protein
MAAKFLLMLVRNANNHVVDDSIDTWECEDCKNGVPIAVDASFDSIVAVEDTKREPSTSKTKNDSASNSSIPPSANGSNKRHAESLSRQPQNISRDARRSSQSSHHLPATAPTPESRFQPYESILPRSRQMDNNVPSSRASTSRSSSVNSQPLNVDKGKRKYTEREDTDSSNGGVSTRKAVPDAEKSTASRFIPEVLDLSSLRSLSASRPRRLHRKSSSLSNRASSPSDTPLSATTEAEQGGDKTRSYPPMGPSSSTSKGKKKETDVERFIRTVSTPKQSPSNRAQHAPREIMPGRSFSSESTKETQIPTPNSRPLNISVNTPVRPAPAVAQNASSQVLRTINANGRSNHNFTPTEELANQLSATKLHNHEKRPALLASPSKSRGPDPITPRPPPRPRPTSRPSTGAMMDEEEEEEEEEERPVANATNPSPTTILRTEILTIAPKPPSAPPAPQPADVPHLTLPMITVKEEEVKPDEVEEEEEEEIDELSSDEELTTRNQSLVLRADGPVSHLLPSREGQQRDSAEAMRAAPIFPNGDAVSTGRPAATSKVVVNGETVYSVETHTPLPFNLSSVTDAHLSTANSGHLPVVSDGRASPPDKHSAQKTPSDSDGDVIMSSDYIPRDADLNADHRPGLSSTSEIRASYHMSDSTETKKTTSPRRSHTLELVPLAEVRDLSPVSSQAGYAHSPRSPSPNEGSGAPQASSVDLTQCASLPSSKAEHELNEAAKTPSKPSVPAPPPQRNGNEVQEMTKPPHLAYLWDDDTALPEAGVADDTAEPVQSSNDVEMDLPMDDTPPFTPVPSQPTYTRISSPLPAIHPISSITIDPPEKPIFGLPIARWFTLGGDQNEQRKGKKAPVDVKVKEEVEEVDLNATSGKPKRRRKFNAIRRDMGQAEGEWKNAEEILYFA